jgi:Ca2+-binding RTX toxin-like protein
VNSLVGTDVNQVNLNLAATGGAGDGAVDTVIINGTSGNDIITAAGDASGVSVNGFTPQVNITGHETTDKLSVNTFAGADVITGAGLLAGALAFTADGGQGDDILVGSVNNDSLFGNDGDDVLIGNGGVDVLDGGAGSNTIIP